MLLMNNINPFYNKNYENFEQIIYNCKKIISAYAFLCNNSINLIKYIREGEKKLIINYANPYNRTAKEIKKMEPGSLFKAPASEKNVLHFFLNI